MKNLNLLLSLFIFSFGSLFQPLSGQFQMPGMPRAGNGMPQGPGFGGPQFGPGNRPAAPGPQGPGFKPISEREIDEAIRAMEAMSPEEIAAAERMGQMIIANMTDEEFAMAAPMFESMGLNPADVRDEARKAIAEYAAAEAAMSAGAPLPPAAMPQEEFMRPAATAAQPKTEQPVAPAPSKTDVRQTGALIAGLIENLSTLQQKASSVRDIHEMVRSWLQELRELMFFLRVIDKHNYHEHLAQPQFKKLMQTLSALLGEFKRSMPELVLPDDLTEESDPYDVLGISINASQKTIDTAYKTLAEKDNIEKLTTKLKNEGLSDKDIKRQVKYAQTRFDTLEDAYEQIKDPKTRTQIDREIKKRKEILQDKIDRATKAIRNLTEALSDAIYRNQLLQLLEQFMQSYAPKQLAWKKDIEEAEKKRLEEHKKLSSMAPSATPSFAQPTISYGSAPSYGGNDYGYSSYLPYDDYNDYSDYPSYGYNSPYDSKGYGSSSSPGSSSERGDGSKEGEGGEGKDKDKAKDKEKDKDKKDGEKPDSPEIIQLINSIENNLNGLTEALANNANKTIDDFASYMSKPITRKPTAAPLEEEEELTGLAEETPEELQKRQAKEQKQKEEEAKRATAGPQAIHSLEPQRNETLKELRTSLRLETLVKDSEKLQKKLRSSEKTPSNEQKKAFLKVIEKLEKNETKLTKLQEKLAEALQNAPEEKIKAHKAAIIELLEELAKFTNVISDVADKYFGGTTIGTNTKMPSKK